MTDNTLSVSVIVKAPLERVWPLLIEQQQSNGLKILFDEHVQSEPEGPPVAGQVIHVKGGPLKSTTYIDRVVRTDPPVDGQTIFARVVFLGRDGESIARWFHDAEHHHIQTQSEVHHPWCTIIEQTDRWCLAMDTASCVIVYVQQSEMTFRLVPRWLTRQLNNDKMVRKTTTEAIEAFLQSMKAKAEQVGISEKKSV